MKKISMFKPYVNEKAVELVSQTLRSGWIGEGPRVFQFEERVRAITKAAFTVSTSSGTSALHLALLAAGIKPGAEVITTAQTMLATTQMILASGASPVYADIEYGTGNIAAADIVKRITARTQAILAVDWGGYPCDYDVLLHIVKEHRLALVEDAAHAFGAQYRGKPIGSVCPFTCFSFQAIKLITSGDGGAVCISDENSYQKIRRLRWFGIDRAKRNISLVGESFWNVTELGYKYQMNDIAASVGLGNLEDFERLLARRHEIVAVYRERLQGVPGVRLFDRIPDRESSDWLFTLHVAKRDDFCRMMREKNIEVSVVHLRIDRNEICGPLRDDVPELARFTDTHISLPLHNYLTDEEVGFVVESVRGGW